MRKFLILTALCALFLCGCSGYRQVEISGVQVQKVKLVSTSDVDLDLAVEVDNPTRSTFTVSDLEGMLSRNGAAFARVTLREDAVVYPRTVADAELRCRIHLLDPLAVLVMGLDFRSWKPEEFRLDLAATVRSGAVKKKFRMQDVPVAQVLNRIKRK